MTTFQEQFPSLQGKIGEDDCGGMASINPITYITVEDVEKYCLDKQRVKEGIEKVALLFKEYPDKFTPLQLIIELHLELGL